ncbi:helix-turn-helix domain-containing protein [Streptomyces microflavus]|uniref:helix-turn-helix domain-containing protein n=1 Tax=Streptomyces microflavus TaxID=1919 RepID=UPI003B215FBF
MPTDPCPTGYRPPPGHRGQRPAGTAAGLTQEGLAGRAGLDRKTVNRLEQGATSPLLDHLLVIADAIGVPLSDLVREEFPPAPDSPRPGTDGGQRRWQAQLQRSTSTGSSHRGAP